MLCPLIAHAETLTLEDALRMARARHPSLEAARAQIEAARARQFQARAGFAPSLTGSFSWQPQTANFVLTPGFARVFSGPPTTSATVADVGGASREVQCVAGANCPNVVPAAVRPITGDMFNFWSAGVGLIWTAWDWGRAPYAMRSADASASAQKLSADAVMLEITLGVKVAYFAALAAQAGVGVAQESLAATRKHLAQAKAFHEVGTRTRIDVASAESEVARAELLVARALGDVDASHALLAAALGEERWRDGTLVPPSVRAVADAGDDAALADEAARARPEPRELRLRAQAAGESARSLRGGFLPALSLTLGPSFAGLDITSLTTNFTAGVTLGYGLGGTNPFLIHGLMREARAAESVARAQARAAENGVRLETANARAQLRANLQAVAAARKLTTAARERRDLADGRYQAGVGSMLELTDAELNFVSARFQEVRAILDVETSRARLDRALGRL
jgi:outer membrane protein